MAPERGYGQKDQRRLTRSLIPLSSTGGSHGDVYRSKKRKKDGTYTRYIHIYKADDDPHFVADYSAITSELLRFVSTDVFPKVRVITRKDSHTGNRESIGYLSAEIQGYQTAWDLIDKEPAKLNSLFTDSDTKRQLAALFVGAYFTAENDLHGGNWGVDAHGNIKKIDNDQALFHHTAGYKGLSGAYIYEKTFTQFPNMIFPREKAFELTSHDIENLPMLDFAKPANWPSDDIETLRHLKILSQDPEFKKYKWQYFTKLLLVQDRQLHDICTAHTLDEPKREALYTELLDRQVKLREVLLRCPEYREFLVSIKENEEILEDLVGEFKSYDKQFESKYKLIDPKTRDVIAEPGDIKPKYSDRIFFNTENSIEQLADVLEDLIADGEKITPKIDMAIRHQELENARELHIEGYINLVGDTIISNGRSYSSLDVLDYFINNRSSKLEDLIESHLKDKYESIIQDYYNKMVDNRYHELESDVKNGFLASDTDIIENAREYAQDSSDDLFVMMLRRYDEIAKQIQNIDTEILYYETQFKQLEDGEKFESLSQELKNIISQIKLLLNLPSEMVIDLTQKDQVDFLEQKLDELTDADDITESQELMDKLEAVFLEKQDLMAQMTDNQAKLVDLKRSLGFSEPTAAPERLKPVQQVATRLFRVASSAPSSTAPPASSRSVSTPPVKTKTGVEERPTDAPIPPRGTAPKGRA